MTSLYEGAALARLKAVESAMMEVLTAQGCAPLDPPALLSAAEVLRLYGERARAEAYVFEDRDSGALCLRPDFTVPIGARHVALMQGGAPAAARYAYAGPVYARARGESRQVGFELFGEEDRLKGDLAALDLTLGALKAAGIPAPAVEMGDVAIIEAAIEALRDVEGAPLPEARRARLRRHYWRPAQFMALLEAYAKPGESRLAFLDSLPRVARFAALTALSGREPDAEARSVLSDVIEEAGGPLIGSRTLDEIVARLREEAIDARRPPLAPESFAFIKALLAIDAPAVEAVARIGALGVDLGAAFAALKARVAAMAPLAGRLRFRAQIRSRLEYYSGFVFRVSEGGRALASGGRYGGLLEAMGAPRRVPAVGAAMFVSLIAPPAQPPAAAPPAAEAPDDEAPLALAVPSKGRLKEQIQEWFAARGLRLVDVGKAREYAARLEGVEGVEARLMSASEIAHKIASGEIDAGVTGEDLVHENIARWKERMRVAARLGFGRADLVVAVPQCWADVADMADLDDVASEMFRRTGAPLRVATKYLHLTREEFEKRGLVNYVIVESLGATEAAPAAGTADIIVDITSTGETLRDNHLKILTKPPMLESEACLFVTKRPLGARAAAALKALEAKL